MTAGGSISGGRIAAGALFVAAVTGGYWLLSESGLLATIMDAAALREWIAGLGMWGPVAVVGLMMLAILVSPIPSAPIAIAAGAAWGHVLGTIIILVGAEAGALAAFGIARHVGHEALHRRFGDRLTTGLLGSPNALTGIVFISRLLPFISFDLVSYAAGLSTLSFWRFAVATLAGIVPASFLLAHFGEEMASGETRRVMFSVLALGGITLIPVAVKLVRDALRKRRRR